MAQTLKVRVRRRYARHQLRRFNGGETPWGMAGCPYYRGVGCCDRGCMDEPRCMTCEPETGWLGTGLHGVFSTGAN